jgi:ABC-2 type transport system permease protein
MDNAIKTENLGRIYKIRGGKKKDKEAKELIAHHVWFLGEAVAGALYLFSGAIFPLEVLPPAIRWIGYLLPITYWLELLRRSLVGDVAEAFSTLSGFSNLELMGILVALTVFFGISSIVVFRWCNHRARERGLIDMVTNY